MLADGPLDRNIRELIALAVSIVSHCEYCSLAYEAMAGRFIRHGSGNQPCQTGLICSDT